MNKLLGSQSLLVNDKPCENHVSLKLLEEVPNSNFTQAYNKKAVVYHLYYPELTVEAIETVNEFDSSYDKVFTVAETLPQDYIDLIKASTDAKIFVAPNSGRDIFPFWLLVKQGILDQYELICKLHGKKSLHRTDGDEWRKLSIKHLAGSQKRIQLIEDLFFDNSHHDLCFIAPKAKALLSTSERHWLGNLKWLKELSLRLGSEVNIEEVAGTAIMAGSFYWLNAEGVNKFRNIPISLNDWEDNHAIEDKIDGKLEHFIERVLLLNRPFYKTKKSKVGFITEKGEVDFISNLSLGNKLQVSQQVEHADLRHNKFININSNYYQTQSEEHVLGTYHVEYSNDRTIISGCILDYCNPHKRFELQIYINSQLMCSVEACEEFNLSETTDFCQSNYGFQVEIPNNINLSDIDVYEKKSRYRLERDKPLNRKMVETNLFLNQINRATFLFPEVIRQLKTSFHEYLENTNVINSVTISRAMAELKEINTQELVSKTSQTKHVFIVNNPIAEIAVARVIEKHNLSVSNVLIILHRVKNITLLKDFCQLNTNLIDVEQLFSREQLINAFEVINRILDKIGDCDFVLYSHHYNAIFTSVLGMLPRCVKTNLVEEGNLSSVSNWEAQLLSKKAQYTNLKGLIKKDKNVDYSNSILSLVFGSEFEYINYSILKSHFPNVLNNLEILQTDISQVFKSEKNSIDLEQFVRLLLLKRYYLWHPKMICGNSFYTVSRAFKSINNSHKITSPSEKEKELSIEYKKLLKNPTALILLPTTGRFHLLDKLQKSNSDFFDFFKDVSVGGEVYFVLHPADRSSKEARMKAIEMLNKFSIFKTLEARDLCEVVGDSPVTEVAATCFKYVVHYGSSLSLVFRQYEAETQELFLDTFN